MFWLGFTGFCITLYAIYVEKSKNKPLCDINENISCTRVLRSPYGHMIGLMFKLSRSNRFNVPNTYYGIMFYFGLMLYDVCPLPGKEVLLLIGAVMSCLASLGLAYILYFKLKDFCVVCVASYIVNLTILYYAWYEYLGY